MHKLTRLALAISLVVTAPAWADSAAPAPIVPSVASPSQTPSPAEVQAQLAAAQAALNRAHARYGAAQKTLAATTAPSPDPAPVDPRPYSYHREHHKAVVPTAAYVASLEKKLDWAKGRLRLASINDDAAQRADDVEAVNGRVVFNYEDSAIYHIDTAIGHETALELQPGEHLVGTKTPISGDTVRWDATTTEAGSGADQTTIVVIKPKEPDISTNMLITTNRHIYNVVVSSGDDADSPFMPVVSWNYPYDQARAQAAQQAVVQKARDVEEPIKVNPANLHFAYKVSGGNYPWTPLRVFDNGTKTFIEMSPTMKSYDAPALFVLDGGKPEMVNYRVKGDYYIVDRLFVKAQLRVGPKDAVSITHGDVAPRQHNYWN